jgi:hypothetical protein
VEPQRLDELGGLMDSSIFAIELCAKLVPQSPLRAGLCDLVRNAPVGLSLHAKWQQYQRASQLVLESLHLVEKGCWDFFDDDARAKRDYRMWTDGMLTSEGARDAPSGLVDPYRGEPRYLTFTMAMLLVQQSPTERMMAQTCNIPEPYLWKRETFARILRGMNSISFASVKSDVMYLIPRDDEWALTAQDLTAQKFAYLRQVVD